MRTIPNWTILVSIVLVVTILLVVQPQFSYQANDQPESDISLWGEHYSDQVTQVPHTFLFQDNIIYNRPSFNTTATNVACQSNLQVFGNWTIPFSHRHTNHPEFSVFLGNHRDSRIDHDRSSWKDEGFSFSFEHDLHVSGQSYLKFEHWSLQNSRVLVEDDRTPIQFQSNRWQVLRVERDLTTISLFIDQNLVFITNIDGDSFHYLDQLCVEVPFSQQFAYVVPTIHAYKEEPTSQGNDHLPSTQTEVLMFINLTAILLEPVGSVLAPLAGVTLIHRVIRRPRKKSTSLEITSPSLLYPHSQ